MSGIETSYTFFMLLTASVNRGADGDSRLVAYLSTTLISRTATQQAISEFVDHLSFKNRPGVNTKGPLRHPCRRLLIFATQIIAATRKKHIHHGPPLQPANLRRHVVAAEEFAIHVFQFGRRLRRLCD